jgi:flagellar biogenesis protein FliO
MAEKLLKILYVFMAFVNVFLYGVSFILRTSFAPVQDASDISAVEGTELASEVAVSYPLGEQLLSTAIKLSIILAIILVVYVVGKIMKQRKLKQA